MIHKELLYRVNIQAWGDYAKVLKVHEGIRHCSNKNESPPVQRHYESS